MNSEREMDNDNTTDSRKRVLAIDDDPSIRHMLDRVLSRTYDLVLAAEGEQALAEIKRQRPDLVLLDLRMPVMDGSELLERLEAEGIDVPVVLMTAEIRHGFLDSPLVRARHDKLLGVDALLETCARVLAGTGGPAKLQ
jgi:CheY-like chemotaxis protein